MQDTAQHHPKMPELSSLSLEELDGSKYDTEERRLGPQNFTNQSQKTSLNTPLLSPPSNEGCWV
eukprot:3365615-Karenia_brevis.AAC.1